MTFPLELDHVIVDSSVDAPDGGSCYDRAG